MAGEDFSFIGDAIVSVAPYGTTTFRDIGNCSSANIAHSLDKKSLPNYRDGAGGSRNSRARISEATLDLAMNDYYAENLALWASGSVSASGADSLVDALTSIGSFFIIRVAGTNVAQDTSFEAEFFKCTIDPADNISLITAGEYASANMKINILADDSIGAGSKYYTLTNKG